MRCTMASQTHYQVRTSIIVCTVSASLSGCLFLHSYPQRWSPLASISDPCGRLAGRYSPTGEYGDPSAAGRYGPAQLLAYLHAYPEQLEERRRIDKIDTVELTFGGDRILRMRALQNADVITERTYSEKDGTLSCNGDGAEILSYGPSLPGGKTNPLAGVTWGATYLRRSDDGSLIVKTRETGVGLVFMFLPFAGGETNWVRFPAKD